MRMLGGSLAIVLTVLVTIAMLGSGCAAPPAPAPQAPTPEPNEAPVISSLTAQPSAVLYGDSVAVTCIASDPEDDAIKYAWSASDGVITGTGKEITWIAPNKEGNFNITVTLTDYPGAQTTGNVMVSVSNPVKTITIEPDAAATGTVDQKNATDYSRTRAGDDASNVGYRAFWSFNIGKVAGKNIQNASLKFTTKYVTGEPFWYGPATGLGGLTLWKTTHGSSLPGFDNLGGKLSSTGSFLEPPTVIDVTTEIGVLAEHNVGRFQVEALFDRVSNGNNVLEMIEWSSVVLEITYSDR